MMTLLLLVFLWLVCGAIATCGYFAYWQKKFPGLAESDYREDASFSMGTCLPFGPFALLMTCMVTGFYQYGFKVPFLDKKKK